MSAGFSITAERDPDAFECLGCGREITRDVEPSGMGWWIDDDLYMAAVCINAVAPDGLHVPDLRVPAVPEPPC